MNLCHTYPLERLNQVQRSLRMSSHLWEECYSQGKSNTPAGYGNSAGFSDQQVEIEGLNEVKNKRRRLQKQVPKQPAAKTGALINESVLAKATPFCMMNTTKCWCSLRRAIAQQLQLHFPSSNYGLNWSLISHLKEYHVLKFAPRILNDQDYNYHNAVLSALTSYKIAQWCGYPQKDWMQAAFAGSAS
jgi:hypothetical protein